MAFEWLVSFVKDYALISVILFSAIITVALTFVYKKLTNQKRMQEIKEKQKELQGKLKNEKDQEKIMKINQEMMQISSEMLKMSFKPMLITFLPVILIFTGLKWLYTQANVGNIISWGTKLPLVGDGAGWFLCYFVISFVFSILCNNVLKLFEPKPKKQEEKKEITQETQEQKETVKENSENGNESK